MKAAVFILIAALSAQSLRAAEAPSVAPEVEKVQQSVVTVTCSGTRGVPPVTVFGVATGKDRVMTLRAPVALADTVEVKTADGKKVTVQGVFADDVKRNVVLLCVTGMHASAVKVAPGLPAQGDGLRVVRPGKTPSPAKVTDSDADPIVGTTIELKTILALDAPGCPVIDASGSCRGIVTAVGSSSAMAIPVDSLGSSGARAVAIAEWRKSLRPGFEAPLQKGAELVFLDKFTQARPLLEQAAKADPRSPDPHILLCYCCAMEEKLDDALTALTKACELDGDNPFLHSMLGALCERLGKADQAIAAYDRSLKLHDARYKKGSASAAEYMDAGRVAVRLARYAAAIRENPESEASVDPIVYYSFALTALRKSVELTPSDYRAHRELGRAYVNMGRYAEALAAAEESARLAPDEAGPLLLLQEALLGAHRYDDCVSSCKAALARFPKEEGFHWRLAVACRGLEKYDDSIAACRKAIELRQNWLEPRLALALTYYQAERYRESVEAAREAVKRFPSDISAQLSLALALRALESPEAIDVIKKLAALYPDSPRVHVGLGSAYSDAGEREKAVAEFREAVRLAPRWAWARLLLGRALADAGDFEGAIEPLLEALRLSPGYVSAMSNLGWVYRELNRWQDALPVHLAWTSADPESAQAWASLGFVYYRLGKRQEAIGPCKEALRLDPGYVWSAQVLAWAYERTGQKEKAAEVSRKVTAMKPRDADGYVDLGEAYEALDKDAEAIAAYRAAIKIDPGSATAYSRLAEALVKSPLTTEEALEVAKKGAKMRPSSHLSHCCLGRVFLRRRNPQAALQSLKKAVDLDPTCPASLSGLAAAYLGLGQLEDARRAANEHCRLFPQSADGYYILGLICANQHDREGLRSAIRVLEKLDKMRAAELQDRVTE